MCYWAMVILKKYFDFAPFNCQDERKSIWAYRKFSFIT